MKELATSVFVLFKCSAVVLGLHVVDVHKAPLCLFPAESAGSLQVIAIASTWDQSARYDGRQEEQQLIHGTTNSLVHGSDHCVCCSACHLKGLSAHQIQACVDDPGTAAC